MTICVKYIVLCIWSTKAFSIQDAKIFVYFVFRTQRHSTNLFPECIGTSNRQFCIQDAKTYRKFVSEIQKHSAIICIKDEEKFNNFVVSMQRHSTNLYSGRKYILQICIQHGWEFTLSLIRSFTLCFFAQNRSN